MMKTPGNEGGERMFARMTERGMPEVVAKRNGFDEGFHQPEPRSDGARKSGDLERMGQPRTNERIARRCDDLRFGREAPKSAADQNPIAIAGEVTFRQSISSDDTGQRPCTEHAFCIG